MADNGSDDNVYRLELDGRTVSVSFDAVDAGPAGADTIDGGDGVISYSDGRTSYSDGGIIIISAIPGDRLADALEDLVGSEDVDSVRTIGLDTGSVQEVHDVASRHDLRTDG